MKVNSLQTADRVKSLILALPVQRKSGNIPWGYRPSKKDDALLEPIEELFALLLQAKQYLKTCSLREIATWLSAKSGVRISGQGLHKLMLERKPDDRCTLPLKERQRLL